MKKIICLGYLFLVIMSKMFRAVAVAGRPFIPAEVYTMKVGLYASDIQILMKRLCK